jgi:pyruvate/2-oxoglutarate dehydrogenase complex dihydrolipoamide acyltransferase (E2) component
MKVPPTLLSACAALAITAGAAAAQSTTNTPPDSARHAHAGARRQHQPLTPAQKQYRQEFGVERKRLHAEIANGHLTKQQAAHELKAWRHNHPPPKN